MLSKIENGSALPSLDLLEQLCARLGARVSDVISDEYENKEAQVVIDQIMDLIARRDYKDAIHYGKAALRLKVIQKSPCMTSECLRLMGWAYHNSRDYSNAITFYKKGADTAKSHDTGIYLSCLNGLAASFIELQNYDAALPILMNAYERFETVVIQPRIKIRILYNLAKVNRRSGNIDQAKRYIREGLELSHRTGIFDAASHLETMMGLILLDEGNPKSACTYFRRALHFCEFNDDIEGKIGSYINLAESYIRQSQIDEAAEILGFALSIAKSRQDIPPTLLSLLKETMTQISR